MVRKCGVEGCLSDSNRPEDIGVTFHKVPMHPDIRPKWLSLCRISEEKKTCKVIYVCSRHFLRADFCNFKGKKYMLKQGVLPSVFPWDKSKLEAIKAEIKKEIHVPNEVGKIEPEAPLPDKIKKEPGEAVSVKEEVKELSDPKQEPYPDMFLADVPLDSSVAHQSSSIDPVTKSAETNYGRINFVIDSQIEALDFNNTWYPAKIAEVDYEENEVLIHFETFSSNYDEWICMDSPRLRPLQQSSLPSKPSVGQNEGQETEVEKMSNRNKPSVDQFVVGERCMAAWSDARKFPAIVTKVLEDETYEVLFDDGFAKVQKAHKMLKTEGRPIQSSPLFDPIQSTKQERRDKKRKLNVATLFKKRPRLIGEGDPKQKQSPPSAQQKQSPLHKKETSQQPKQSTVVHNKSGSKSTPAAMSSKHSAKSHSRAHRKSDTSKTSAKSTMNKSQVHDAAVTQQNVGVVAPGNEQPIDKDKWLLQWVNGMPVGVASTLDTQDGPRKSIIVADPRIPEGWTKHLVQRPHGQSAGKWDTIIIGTDSKRFRTKSEIRAYMEANPQLNLQESMFDFSLQRQRHRQVKAAAAESEKSKAASDVHVDSSTPTVPSSTLHIKEEQTPEIKEEDVDNDLPPLKILHVDDAYKCPIEGCGKNFRRENLAQMHVKHYHPEYTKFLDSTPNVADLAYARTVGDSLDRSPGPPRTPPSRSVQKSTASSKAPSLAKGPQSPLVESDIKPLSPQATQHKATKDTEIIKLLNSKSLEPPKESDGGLSPVPPPAPALHPDIKLRDLLSKSEGIPRVDDLALKNLGSTRPTGIKTLLPVRPPEVDPPQEPEPTRKPHSSKASSKHGTKRKKATETIEQVREKEKEPAESVELPPQEPPPPPPEQPTHIIEGGKVIKIVRMKQEEIINCTCGYAEEDGLMIQCELCLCWQHAYCNNIERESQVPEKYVCFICQNPARQRPSRKYYHDQDWLKLGMLPTANYHTKDEAALQKQFEELRKTHDISGGLVELQEFVHSLSVKLKIAEDKAHPKLYLWSEPWEKLPLPEKMETEEVKIKQEQETNLDQSCDKGEVGEMGASGHQNDTQNDTMLMMILKDAKEESKLDLNTLMESNQVQAPIIPQPEAAIDSAVCRVNLLEHISHSQNLVEERLDDFEKRLEALEEGLTVEEGEDYPKTRQTIQMLLRDLKRLEEFSMLSSI